MQAAGDGLTIEYKSPKLGELQDWAAQSSGCSGLFTRSSPGLAYDSSSNRIVGWVGGNTVYQG